MLLVAEQSMGDGRFQSEGLPPKDQHLPRWKEVEGAAATKNVQTKCGGDREYPAVAVSAHLLIYKIWYAGRSIQCNPAAVSVLTSQKKYPAAARCFVRALACHVYNVQLATQGTSKYIKLDRSQIHKTWQITDT